MDNLDKWYETAGNLGKISAAVVRWLVTFLLGFAIGYLARRAGIL
jgi:hypothetical protein